MAMQNCPKTMPHPSIEPIRRHAWTRTTLELDAQKRQIAERMDQGFAFAFTSWTRWPRPMGSPLLRHDVFDCERGPGYSFTST